MKKESGNKKTNKELIELARNEIKEWQRFLNRLLKTKGRQNKLN